MSVLVFALLIISATVTSVISAVAGMGGGVVLLSIMTFFLGIEVIVPIHGIVQLASNSTRTFSLLSNVKRNIFFPAVLTMPIGTYLSVQLIQSIQNREVLYFLIAGIIFYTLFKPKKMPSLQIPPWSFSILGFVAGFLNPLIGATGPLLAPFYLRDDLKKEEIIATKAAVQTFGHLIKIPAFLFLGFEYSKYALLILLMVIAVIFGTRFGIKILKGIDEKTFRLVFRGALFIAATRVLYKAIQVM